MTSGRVVTGGGQFKNAELLIEIMEDPDRVVKLEWRRIRSEQNKSMTSHSMLDAHLLKGDCVRLERFQDTGLVECRYEFAIPEAVEGDIYNGRVAGESDLARPFRMQDLRDAAVAICRRPYSVRCENCHHMVRDLWNIFVIKQLRSSHYPDRVKSGVLRSFTKPMSSIKRVITPTASNDAIPESDDASDEVECQASEVGKSVNICVRREEASRLSGDFVAMDSYAPEFDLASRLKDFKKHLAAGSVQLLEAGGPLITLAYPAPGLALETAWLPAGEAPSPGGVAEDMAVSGRLACRVATSDITDLLWRLPAISDCEATLSSSASTASPSASPSWFASVSSPSRSQQAQNSSHTGLSSAPSHEFAFPERTQSAASSMSMCGGDNGGYSKPWNPSASILESRKQLQSSSASCSADDPISSVCFVVLRGADEIRLALYAVVHAPACGLPHRRLRLLSGDARTGAEATFNYSISNLPRPESEDGLSQRPTALELVNDELQALLTAVGTGEWGFLTLL